MLGARKGHHGAHSKPRSGLFILGRAWVPPRRRRAQRWPWSVLGHAKAPDVAAIDGQLAVANGITHVALNDLNGLAIAGHHNTNMVRRAGVVRGGVVAAVLPVIENVVTRAGYIGIILHPGAQLFEKVNVALTSALRGDDVREAAGDGHSGCKGGAPGIRVFHRIAPGQGLVGVVEVNDFAVGAVGLFAAQIAHRSVHNFLPEFFFSH